MSAFLNTFGAMQDAPIATPTETSPPAQETNPAPQETPAAPVIEAAAAETAAPPTTTEDFSSTMELSLGDDLPTEINTTEKPPLYNWKDELRKLDRNEVAAELGIDAFALELDRYLKSGGQAVDYLMARAIDYNKFTDEALVKNNLAIENPTLSPRQIELLYNRRYNVSEDASEEDKEFVQAQLQSDASKIRQAEISKQQKFKIPDTPIPQKDEAYEQWKQNTQVQAQNEEAMRGFIREHQATKALNESKRVTVNLGEGVAPFNFVINDPAIVNRVLTDDGTAWSRLTSTPQGEPDVAKQQLLTLIAFNPQKALQDIYNYGVQMGERKRVSEGQNAQKPQAVLANIGTGEKATYRTGTYGNK